MGVQRGLEGEGKRQTSADRGLCKVPVAEGNKARTRDGRLGLEHTHERKQGGAQESPKGHGNGASGR